MALTCVPFASWPVTVSRHVPSTVSVGATVPTTHFCVRLLVVPSGERRTQDTSDVPGPVATDQPSGGAAATVTSGVLVSS